MNLCVILPWGYNLGEGGILWASLLYNPGYSLVGGYILGCYTGFRTNVVLCWLSNEVPYLDIDGGGAGMHTYAVRNTCSGVGVITIVHVT